MHLKLVVIMPARVGPVCGVFVERGLNGHHVLASKLGGQVCRISSIVRSACGVDAISLHQEHESAQLTVKQVQYGHMGYRLTVPDLHLRSTQAVKWN